jgi:hypothetical protein
MNSATTFNPLTHPLQVIELRRQLDAAGLAATRIIGPDVRGAFSTGIYPLEDVIELHAFAPLDVLPCVRLMPFLSGVHSSYQWVL